MDSSKPYLLNHVVVGPHRSIWIRPQSGLKLRSTLIDTDRMNGLFYVRMQGSIEESVLLLVEDAKEQAWNSKRSYRVPDADHADDDWPQSILLIEARLQLLFLGGAWLPGRVKNYFYGHIVEIFCGNAKTRDHACETARGVGATTEPEEIDFVPRVVDIRDEFIAILNFLEEPLAHGPAEQMIYGSPIRANSAIVVAQL